MNKRVLGGSRPNVVHDHVRDEATAWLIGFCEKEIDTAGCQRFEAWLKASPENVRAYLQVAAVWEAADRITGTRKVDVNELLQRAMAEQNVVELEPPRHTPWSWQRPLRRTAWHRPVLVAASLALLGLLGAGGLWWLHQRPTAYQTGIGEERTIFLPDASTVTLDARTKIRIEFTKSVRLVDLLHGQALFGVTHNPAIPFIVRTRDATIRDVGTKFDVESSEQGTVITVLHGRIAADSTPGFSTPVTNAGGGVLVSTGEQLIVAPHVHLRPIHVNPSIATAWMQGELVFHDTPLNEVVEQFNRYNQRPISIDDPSLLSLHVSGTFKAADSTELIEFLSQRFGLVAHKSAGGIRLTRP